MKQLIHIEQRRDWKIWDKETWAGKGGVAWRYGIWTKVSRKIGTEERS
jgi:hypothetical protein